MGKTLRGSWHKRLENMLNKETREQQLDSINSIGNRLEDYVEELLRYKKVVVAAKDWKAEKELSFEDDPDLMLPWEIDMWEALKELEEDAENE